MRPDLAALLIDLFLRALFALSPRIYRRALDPSSIAPDAILVARPDHIGDAVLATPALQLLRRRFPSSRIVFLVGSWAAPLFRHHRDADRVITIDCPWWAKRHGAPSGLLPAVRRWWDFLRGVAGLRRERFDLYIDLRGDVRQLVFIGCLCGARHMLTYRRNGGDFLADWSLPLPEDRHEIEQGCNLVRVLGAGTDTPAARIPFGPAEHAAIDEILITRRIADARHTVLIHPGAKQVNRWPLDHYAELVTHTLRRYDAVVLVTGSPLERDLAARLAAIDPARVFSLAGSLSLIELVALFARVDAIVSADTGPMHFLNAVSTRAVLLFGPTDPRRFAPRSGMHKIIRGSRCCLERLHEVCIAAPRAEYSACMSSIPVACVASALDGLLADNAIKPGERQSP